MKPEPLKGKYKCEKGIWKSDPFWMLCTRGQEDVLNDVKLAVQGLLEEIEKEIKQTEKILESKDCIGSCIAYCNGVRNALEEVKQKIKKWFGDVLD